MDTSRPSRSATTTRPWRRLLRRALVPATAWAVLLAGLDAPTAAAGAHPDAAPPGPEEVESMPDTADVPLPPPLWLPWEKEVHLDLVSRTAPQAWALAAAWGQVPGGVPATGDTAPLATASGLDPMDYKWPIAPVKVVRPFKPPKHRYGRGHRGVDLRAAPGTPVYAAGPGFVAFSGPVASVGTLSIQHTLRLRTTYQPLTARVPMGTPVIAGTPIGLLSPGGHCLPACLHWGARTGLRTYIDPTLLPDFAPELKPLDQRRRRR